MLFYQHILLFSVILDAPIGQTSDVWSIIVPSIAKLTKVTISVLHHGHGCTHYNFQDRHTILIKTSSI